jgi:hypothetical protein
LPCAATFLYSFYLFFYNHLPYRLMFTSHVSLNRLTL